MLDWKKIRNNDRSYLKDKDEEEQKSLIADKSKSDRIRNNYKNFIESNKKEVEPLDWSEIRKFRPQRAYDSGVKSDNTQEVAQERTWFKKSNAFDDGYQAGDVLKTVGSTAGDSGLNIVKGIMRVGEGIGDLVQGGTAQVLDFVGKDDYANALRYKVSQNAVDQVFQPVTDKLDTNSVLADKADAVAQGIGTTLGFLGSTVATGGASIPLKIGKLAVSMPASVIVSGTGSGLEEAYSKGAEDWQAWTKAIGSGLIEGFSEGLFEGAFKAFKIGGSNLDTITNKAFDRITAKIGNGLAKTLAKTTLDSAEEGVEEVVSYVLNYGLDHASDLIKNVTNLKGKDLAEEFSTEQLWEDFFTGALSAFISGAPANIVSDNNYNKSLGKTTAFDVTNWQNNNIVGTEKVKGHYVSTDRSKLNRDVAVVEKNNQYVAIDVATGTELDTLKATQEEAVQQIKEKISNLTDTEIQTVNNTLMELDQKVNDYLLNTGMIEPESKTDKYINNFIKSNTDIFNISENSSDYYNSLLKLYTVNSDFVKSKSPVAYETFKELEKTDKDFRNLVKTLGNIGEKEAEYKIKQDNQKKNGQEIKNTTPKNDKNRQNDKLLNNENKTAQNSIKTQKEELISKIENSNQTQEVKEDLKKAVEKTSDINRANAIVNNLSNVETPKVTQRNLKNNKKAGYTEKSNAVSINAEKDFSKFISEHQKENANYTANIESNITKAQKFVQDFLKDTYNQEVVYFSENQYTGAEHISTNNPNVIFVNTDLSRYIENGIDENNLLFFATFHGFGHNIKQLYPEQYKELVKIVEISLTEEQKTKYLEQFEGKEKEKMISSQEALVDEIIADHLGSASTDMNFWKQIEEKAKDIYNAIIERLQALYNYLTKDYEGINVFASQKQNAEMRYKLEEILQTIQKDVKENQKAETKKIEKPKVEKKVEFKQKTTEATTHIEDFGEKIGGARKDLAEPRGKQISKEVIHDYRIESTENGFVVKFKRQVLKDGFKTEKEAEAYIMEFKDNLKNNLAFVEEYGKDHDRYIIKIRNTRTLKSIYTNKVFENKEEAENYAMALSMYLKEHGKNLFRPQIQKIERKSNIPNSRKTTGQDILDNYNFKGGEFGNWVKQDERQTFLNYANDSFKDLAIALNISESDIGQNGELGIAFGARGKGLTGAVAHFEPVKKVINMTRLKGAGSLAHEYGHSFDNLLSRISGYNKDGMITSNHFKGTLSDNMKKAVDSVIDNINYSVSVDQTEIDKKNKLYENHRIESLHSHMNYMDKIFKGEAKTYKYNRKTKNYDNVFIPVTKEQQKEYNKIKKYLEAGKVEGEIRYKPSSRSFKESDRVYPEMIEKLRKLYKEVYGRKVNDDTLYWIYRYGKPSKQVTEVKSESAFSKSAVELDRVTGRSTAYFAKIEEKWARAFEAYVSDKLKENGITNTYLVHSVNNSEYALFNPFPAGEERKNINKAFDNLIETMKAEGYLHENGIPLFSNRKLAKNNEIMYNKKGIMLSKREYANVMSLINTNKPNQKVGINTISSANYFYMYINNGFNNNIIIFRAEIVGNEDIINVIRKEIENGTDEKSKTINSIIQTIRDGRKHNNSNNVSSERARTIREIDRLHTTGTRTREKISEGQSNNKGLRDKSRIENSKEKGSFNLQEKDNLGRILSKEQKEFFKDSKIRDRNGNLLVVYHSSNNYGFSIFSKKYLGKGEGTSLGHGFYFTSSKITAEYYKEIAKNNGSKKLGIYQVYLNMKKPLSFSDYNAEKMENRIDEIVKIANPQMDINSSYYEQAYKPYVKGKLNTFTGFIDYIKGYADIQNKLSSELFKQLGYDGIIDGNEYVVFEPNQIKNIDNIYPTSNDDIRYSNRNLQNKTQNVDNKGKELTTAQQKYFKNSKIRNKNGILQRVYHSTPNKFTEFDNDMKGENTGYENAELGFFVTTNKKFSKRFKDIDDRGIKGYTMELYANVTKPIIHPYKAGIKYGEKQANKILKDYLVATDNEEYLKNLKMYVKEGEATSIYDGYMNDTVGEDPFEYASSDREILEEKGYDAVEIIEGYEFELVEGSKSDSVISSYAIFNSNQLKSIDNTNPTDNTDIRYSNRKLVSNRYEAFYSQLERTIDNKMQNSATADSILNLIRNNGIKQDELDFTGIEEYLVEKGTQKVTKKEIQDFIKANQIYIQTVQKSEESLEAITQPIKEDIEKKKWEIKEFLDKYHIPYEPENRPGVDMLEGYGTYGDFMADSLEKLVDLDSFEKDDDGITYYSQYTDGITKFTVAFTEEDLKDEMKYLEALYDELNEARLNLHIAEDENSDYADEIGMPQFKPYSLKGGTNYRELLYRLPNEVAVKKKIDEYGSPHWNETNVLAHTRVQDFEDTEGGKILFIEEIQSDLHQEGRKSGYQKRYNAEERTSLIEKYHIARENYDKIKKDKIKEINNQYNEKLSKQRAIVRQVMEYDRPYDENKARTERRKLEQLENEYRQTIENIDDDPVVDKAYFEYKEADKKLSDFNKEVNLGGIDIRFPFKKNWHEFVLRRMINEAIENGYSKIAWTTGMQQNKRYNLAQYIDKIRYHAYLNPDNESEFLYNIAGIKNETSVITKGGINESKLKELLGKEISTKIINNVNDNKYDGIIEGENLSVGGEGMKSFYEKIIPEYLNKYLKKWNVKVETINMKHTDGKITEQPGFEITDEMKKSIKETGQVLYSMRKLSKKAIYQEYKDARIRANIAYLNNIIKYKNRVITNIENEIAKKEAELQGKKNQNTKVATKLRLQIEELKHKRQKIQLLYNKKIDLLSNELDKENLKKEASDLVKRDMREMLKNDILPLIEDTELWKDKKAGLLYSRETAERNIFDVVNDKELAQKIVDYVFKPIHTHQAERVKLANKFYKRINELNLDTEKKYLYHQKLNIAESNALRNMGKDISKYETDVMIDEATVAQLFLEKKLTEEHLREYGVDITRIKNISNTYKSILDELFDMANEALTINGYAPVDKRENYFPHSIENKPDTILEKMMAVFDIDITDNELPTDIAGITDTFKPGKTWNKNLLQRKTELTDLNALEILEKYIYNMTDVIYTTQDIQKVREFSKQIRYKYASDKLVEKIEAIDEREDLTEDQKQEYKDVLYKQIANPLPNFVTWLDDYGNVLANKKSFSDRAIERAVGRKVYKIVSNIENKISKNIIVGNISVALTNFAPIFQTMATTKVSNVFNAFSETMKTALETMQGIEDTSYVGTTIRNSDFYVNRHELQEINKAKSKLQKVEKAVATPIQMIDRFTTEVIMRARYQENLDKGLMEEEAIEQASIDTAKIMADRSKGALPTVFNAKNPFVKMLTMFQVEVNNTLSNYFKDLPRDISKEQYAIAISKLAIGSYFFNTAMIAVRGGNEVLVDPIRIIGYLFTFLFGDDEEEKESAGKNLSESILSVVPFFQSIAGMMGFEDIGRVPISNAMPDLTNVYESFNSENDTQYRLETFIKEIEKPLLYLGLPFGGAQIKKTVEGTMSMVAGGNYKTTKKGKISRRFKYENLNPLEMLQILIFGQWSSKEAKEYIKSGFQSKIVSKIGK